jgi:hypothetical protein
MFSAPGDDNVTVNGSATITSSTETHITVQISWTHSFSGSGPQYWSNYGAKIVHGSGGNSSPSTNGGSVTVTKKVKISYFNNRNYPIQIKIVDAANTSTVIASPTVAAGTGFIQTITLPTGVDAVVILELVQDFSQDGPVWVQNEGNTEEVTSGIEYPGEETTTEGEPTTTTVVPQSPNLPQPQVNPNTVTSTTNIVILPGTVTPWVSKSEVEGTGSDFTITAYREGVDKLTKSIEGDAIILGDELETPETQLDAAAIASYNDALGKLPASPTLTSLTPASTITIYFEVPTMGGAPFVVEKTIDFAAAPYAAPISIFRYVLLVVLTLTYFLVTFFTVRSAFAGS